MTEREALKLALEALEAHADIGIKADKAITAIKEALAQPEQEPDHYGLTADHLWMSISKDHYDRLKPEYRMTCYTTPQQRKPLTENEIKHLWYEACQTNLELTSQLIVHLARNIEAEHGIKELA